MALRLGQGVDEGVLTPGAQFIGVLKMGAGLNSYALFVRRERDRETVFNRLPFGY